MHIRKIHSKKYYNDSLISIRVERGEIVFKPGQHFSLSIKNKFVNREYSTFSSKDSKYIEFLIKIVTDGIVSNQIKGLVEGDEIFLHGPFGKFLDLESGDYNNLILISSGSGVAPFRSLALSENITNFKLIHGIRKKEDIIDDGSFDKGTVTYCVSGDNEHNYFNGRVTKYLEETSDDIFSNDNLYFICGNKDMIADVYKILIEKHKISSDKIDSETFF